MLDEFTQRVFAATDRREYASKMTENCKACGSEQVQLTSWLGACASWKCRCCGNKWQKDLPPQD